MSKNKIFLSPEEISEIKRTRQKAKNEKEEIEKKAREKIFRESKHNEEQKNERDNINRQLNVLKATKDEKKIPHSETKTYKSTIFNVYLDRENNYTRFIAILENHFDKSDIEEYTISGLFEDFKKAKFTKNYIIEINEGTASDFIIIDGTKYDIYDPNNKSKKNEGKSIEVKKEESPIWFNNLSFYNNDSFFQRKSGRKLKEEEINEIINTIQNSSFINNTDKFLYIQSIKSIKNFKMKDIIKIEEEIRGKNTQIKIKDKA